MQSFDHLSLSIEEVYVHPRRLYAIDRETTGNGDCTWNIILQS